MHYRALLKGEYITAAEFGSAEPTLTIGAVKLVKLEQEDGRQKSKGVIYFSDAKDPERGWVLNRTNLELLAAMLGSETQNWIGRRVTLCAQNVRLGKETTLGIRVKGAPDLKQPLTVEVKLPRRKPVTVRLVPTGKASAADPAEPVPPPGRDVGEEE